jgi:hypothetical protein
MKSTKGDLSTPSQFALSSCRVGVVGRFQSHETRLPLINTICLTKKKKKHEKNTRKKTTTTTTTKIGATVILLTV